MYRSPFLLLLFLCVVTLLLTPLHAQKTTGDIVGVVSDPSGAVVPNASVVAANVATGQVRTATTDPSGNYRLPELEPGTYKVSIKAPSFKESVVNNVQVHVATIRPLNFTLQAGGTTETIEVNANTIQVQTDSAALGEVIDSTQVKELPLNGRSFVQLTQLAPGVSAANNFDSKNKGLQGGVDFSVNGNATTNNLFLVDGANNNDVGSNRTILIYPSLESIAEFKMLRNSYGPEYGQASGGVITIVTKGGSNDWHGSVFYSGRNSAVAARTYFAAQHPELPKPPLRRNDWGYSLGGPVKKDKLFFFWSQEWNRELRGITINSCVPTEAERNGDFSAFAGSARDQCGAVVPNFSNLPAGMVDPTNPLRLTAVDPVGQLLISKFPLPNIPLDGSGNNYSYASPSKLNWRQENARIDYNLTQNNSLMFRYTQDTWSNPAPNAGVYWGDDQFPVLQGNWYQPSKMIIGKLSSTIGTSIVNNVEFAYSNNRINITPGGTNPELMQQLTDAIPTIYDPSLKRASLGIPTMWGGFADYAQGAAGNYWAIAPWNNTLDIYTVRDDISKVHGAHTFKAGVFLGWDGKNEDNSASSAERITFQPADYAVVGGWGTGNQVANVLIPGVQFNNLSEVSTNVRDQLRWRDYEFYFGDTWKIRKNLTLDLGLRYSILLSPFQPDNNVTSFQPWLYDPSKPASDACNGLWAAPGKDPCGDANKQFGTSYSKAATGPNKYLQKQNYHLFAPRLGLAWDPSGTGNWAFRVGAGQFFQRERVSPFYVLMNNAPFAVTINGYTRSLSGAGWTRPSMANLGGNASPSGGRDPGTDTPNSWQWNVSLEHSFAENTALQIGYVGNRGIHLTSNYDINQIPQNGVVADCAPGANYDAIGSIVHYANVPNWGCAPFLTTAGGDAGWQNNGSTNLNSLRPYSKFGELNYWGHNGDSSYHALQVLFKTRYKRSQLQAAYTWSHTISNVLLDDSSGGAGAQNFTDYTRPWLDRGNAPINRPHMFVANATYYLPDLNSSNAFAKQVLGGWELGLITAAQSGNSRTVYQSGVSEDTTMLAGGATHVAAMWSNGRNDMKRPLVTGKPCSIRDGNRVYDVDAFTLVGYQIGSYPDNMEPRGYCNGPSYINTDFSVNKNWKLKEKVNMQFRLDFFNLFNHANFRADQGGYTPFSQVNCGPADANGQYQACSPSNNTITRQAPNGSFGKSTLVVGNAGRELQYSLKFTF